MSTLQAHNLSRARVRSENYPAKLSDRVRIKIGISAVCYSMTTLHREIVTVHLNQHDTSS
eukprot:216658-Hanusia_phi.AAC.1